MRRGLAGLLFNHVPPARATACQQKALTGRGQGGADQLGQLGLVARVSARSPWPCLVSTSRMNRLSKISVKYAKVSQNIRQISLNFSQNFVPPDDAAVDVVGLVVDCVHERGHDGGRLLGGHDVEVEREDLVALCDGDAFGV